jgi:23S rRNA (uridine2552-2'-O)-methyltransferase
MNSEFGVLCCFYLFVDIMPRSKSSKLWLKEHFDDPFVKKAKLEGYRSRAVYKLKEIDAKEHLLKPGLNVVDLGAAPGGWTQYVSEKLNSDGTIIALDLLPMDSFSGVEFILGDFSDDAILEKLLDRVPVRGLDLLLSDMAPNMSGSYEVDIPRAMYLSELVLDFGDKMLKPGGNLLMKVFHGSGFDELVKQTRLRYKKVTVKKPSASRSRSRETYLLAKGYNL